MKADEDYDPASGTNFLYTAKDVSLAVDRYVYLDSRSKDISAFTYYERHDCDDMNNFTDMFDYVYSCIYSVDDFQSNLRDVDGNSITDFVAYNVA